MNNKARFSPVTMDRHAYAANGSGTKSRALLLAVGLACIGLLGVGLYLQLAKGMAPCPYCIMQRYAFLAIAAFCLLGALFKAPRVGGVLGLLAALTGAGLAGYHMWIQAHPSVSCGIDPLETALNKIPPAEWFPTLLQADGMCTTEYPPIFGLSIPQWAFAWFVVFSLVLIWTLVRSRRA